MANIMPLKARELFLGGDIDLLNDTIKVTAVDGDGLTLTTATDYINDITAGARIATATLASKSITNGVFDAADVTLTGVTGDEFEYLVIWKDTGNEATSPVILIIDTATGLAFTPSGTDIDITWSNGAGKIFRLTQ